MTSEIKKLPQNVIEITIHLPWSEVDKTMNQMIDEIVKNAEISGFRKGKAPRDLVVKNLNKQSFNEEVLKKLIPENYAKVVKDNDLSPIVFPKIEVVSMEEGKDWVFKATIAQKPEVSLNDFKNKISQSTASEKIWVPGKDQKPAQEEDKNKKLSKNLEILLKETSVDLSDLLIEDELSKLLSELLDEIKKLGLNLEQYLGSTGKTVESLREDYKARAQRNLKLEFLLQEIAASENITVSDSDIESAIKEVKDPKAQEELAKSKYSLASLIRRQKVLDFLASL